MCPMSEEEPDLFADLQRDIDRIDASMSLPQVVQITVNPNAFVGSFLILEMDEESGKKYRDRGFRQPQEVHIHPEDYERLVKQVAPAEGPAGLGEIMGIPVVRKDQ